MTRRRRWWAWAKWSAIVLVGAFGLWEAWRFPWHKCYHALSGADPRLLLAALGVNLLSLASKGWAWHLLLRPVAPHRWWVAQEANLISSAAANLSVPVGEAARVTIIAKREQVPIETAVASVVWTRAVEILALALLLVAAPAFQHREPFLRGLQIGAGVVLVLFLLLSRSGRSPASWPWLPRFARSTVAALYDIGSARRLVWPTILGLVNWMAQWATFHLTFLAVGVTISYSGSFVAVIATNLAGFLRLTPANFGIMQTSMALALVPFSVQPEDAIAAGLAVQAIQVPPVLALAMLFTGWKGLVQIGAQRELPATAAVPPPATEPTEED